MKSKRNTIALHGMLLLIAASAAGRSTSFLIDGNVSCANSAPANDPIVNDFYHE